MRVFLIPVLAGRFLRGAPRRQQQQMAPLDLIKPGNRKTPARAAGGLPRVPRGGSGGLANEKQGRVVKQHRGRCYLQIEPLGAAARDLDSETAGGRYVAGRLAQRPCRRRPQRRLFLFVNFGKLPAAPAAMARAWLVATLLAAAATAQTASPTGEPTGEPTGAPSSAPTGVPSANPTSEPSAAPTTVPSANPTGVPSPNPTYARLRRRLFAPSRSTRRDDASGARTRTTREGRQREAVAAAPRRSGRRAATRVVRGESGRARATRGPRSPSLPRAGRAA